MVNSVAGGRPKKISSIKQGIMVLGRKQLQGWLQLLLYTAGRSDSAKVNPLMQMAATRGAGPSLILIGQVFEVPDAVLDNPRSWAAAAPLHQRSASLAVGLG
jgi:hypothetical protein